MISEPSIFVQDAVLVGGGHTHALLLKQLAMRPLAGVRLTLVSDVTHAPYSGMLPGSLVGTYSYDQWHIDLRRLCQIAGVRFIRAAVVGFDLDSRQVLLEGTPPVAFDLLSINLGSVPGTAGIEGAAEYALPVKPVPQFLAGWDHLSQQAEAGEIETIVLVGGGAGGVELAISCRQRFGPRCAIQIVHRDPQLLSTHNASVQRLLAGVCLSRNIRLHLGETVSKVTPQGVVCKSGLQIAADRVVWVTGASAPTWLGETGLALDEAGFIRVGPTLQSESHPFVFAAGDIATMTNARRAKSGVYAVRAARPLAENVRRYCQGRPLVKHVPQKNFLSLISTADGRAVASKGRFAWYGGLMWRWKDAIDRKFMRQFTDLQPMSGEESSGDDTSSDTDATNLMKNTAMRCQGCAAKVGGSILRQALDRLRREYPEVVRSPDGLSDLHAPDDAAVFSVPEGMVAVQSNDYFPAMVSDPYLLARIAALHGFSDIFAMGAKPHSATALMLIPFGADTVMQRDLDQCLAGLAHELRAMGATLLGGHTAEADRLGIGLNCNGLADPEELLRKQGLQPGDQLLLTKPLGIGTLLAAEMRSQTKGRWVDAAIESMLVSNARASEILLEHGATACTDVTGFGLLGHLWEMVQGTDVAVQLDLVSLPSLDGARESLAAGIRSTIDPQNRQLESEIERATSSAADPRYDLLFDPQTSGGLLAGVPARQVARCLSALHGSGYPVSAIIGLVSKRASGQRPIGV